MSLEDAQKVKKFLEDAKVAAVPLRDKELTKKISEATEHIEKKTLGPKVN